MEAVLYQNKNPNRKASSFPPSNFQAGILPSPPPYFSFSSPPFSSSKHDPLPLPIPFHFTKNSKIITNPLVRGISCPPHINSRTNRNKVPNSNLTPKIPKSLSTTFKNLKQTDKSSQRFACMDDVMGVNHVVSNTKSHDIIHEVQARSKKTPCISKGYQKDSFFSSDLSPSPMEGKLGGFYGSTVSTISPPPSSLPLPSFSMRPKLRCNEKVADFDSGATNDLRRLLRLY